MTYAMRLFYLVVFCLASTAATARSLPIPDPPALGAKTYALVDVASGQMLAAKDADTPVEPASITKLMTCYIVFDEIKQGHLAPTDRVTVSKKAWEMHGSQMFLKVGNKVSVDELLHGLITASGNDAAVALAEYIAGTESTFAGFMNHYAQQLGLSESHFMDANGLPHAQHKMSARDIAVLMTDIIQDFPNLYQRYFHEKKFSYAGIVQYNRNSLLWSDDSVDGGKTGHTEAAGYNLTASATRDGMRLVCAVTGTRSSNARNSQCEALLNYGFRFYESGKLFDAGKQISTVRVWKGSQTELPIVTEKPVYVAYPRGQRDALKTSARMPSTLTAPVAKGKRLGVMRVQYDDKTLTQVPLFAGQDIGEGGFFRRLTDDVMMWFQ